MGKTMFNLYHLTFVEMTKAHGVRSQGDKVEDSTGMEDPDSRIH